MGQDELSWDVEEACMNAWPASKEILFRGWLLRLAGGSTRRTNSVNPLRSCNHDPRPIVEEVARICAHNGQPLVFRVPTIAAGMDAPLAALGFSAEGETRTLLAELDNEDHQRSEDVEIASNPSAEWLALRSRLNGADSGADRAYETTLRSILLPKAFVTLRGDYGIMSMAYGAIDRGYLVVESVASIEQARNRGHARRAVGALMNWGKKAGAKAAALQVVGENAPARALYARLGFQTEIYRYHYRRAPQ